MFPFFSKKNIQKKDKQSFILVLDAGTTGIKAFVFDSSLHMLAKTYERSQKTHPKKGWVEQDPFQMIETCKKVLREVVKKAKVKPSACLGLGITNQRETTIVWNKKTGVPVYPAIVWEDTRTKRECIEIQKRVGDAVIQRTGLPVDSYFSASKIRWILDRAAHAGITRETLICGTVDTWLLWNLCEGHPHLTDETNAARTLLFHIRTRKWDSFLLNLFGIPKEILPKVFPSRHTFGVLKKSVLGFPIPVKAVCGDQQASMYAAMYFSDISHPVTKVTYGTGVFVTQLLGSQYMTHPSFFTTLVPGFHGSLYAFEAKIEGSAKQVDALLIHPKRLRQYFVELAGKVNHLVGLLPIQPQTLVLDGGIVRDGLMAIVQAEISSMPTTLLPTYDGTALGI